MGPMVTLVSAQAALAAGSWEQAAAAFRVVAEETQDPLAFEGLAQAAWWLDDAGTCVAAREGAYRRHRELGDDRGAARAATALSWDSLLFGLGSAVALGWLGRARHLLEPLEESAEHGWLAVREAELALAVARDPVRALAAAERASSVARRREVADLEVVGLALQGCALTTGGEVERGMSRLDAAVAAATGGDVGDVMWMGKVCCWLIAACEQTQDVARAGEWCRRVEEICAKRQLAPLFNVCRIQHASVQIAQGTWGEAERELTSALGRLASSQRASRLDAVVQLGELRRRQGRLAEAEALFGQAEFEPTAVVGRALIRFARGDAEGAWRSLDALLRSIPAENRVARAAALLPAVLTACAADHPEAAAVAADELRHTATSVGTDPLLAMSACADAALAPPVEAAALLRESVRRFGLAGLRYDEADTRLRLAAVLMSSGDTTGARDQLDSAVAELTALSASAGLAEARRLAAMLGAPSAGPLTGRETEVLRLVAQGLSNQEIATSLVLSEHTVHRHMANILAKLGQPSRAAAVAQALTLGLLPDGLGDPRRPD
jgi:ATP/maltotriose-dependent transcriptional regulator MalT